MSKNKPHSDPDLEGFEPTDEELLDPSEGTAGHKVLSAVSREELEASLNQAEAQLAEQAAALADAKNQLVRNYAELDNIRKRAAKDVQSAHKYGLEKLANALLAVIDSLEQGMNVDIQDNPLAKSMHEGMVMTRDLMLSTLEKFSIQQISPQGELFDPVLHQAISVQEQAGADPNSVVQVLQKGYTLNDRLIRPALVVVAK